MNTHMCCGRPQTLHWVSAVYSEREEGVEGRSYVLRLC